MAKIKQLSAHEAQKIAAGEVVERPANIVKELVENSIDAGATLIKLYIEDGGKRLIRIIDNGCGMSAEDAEICFNRHATSKISCIDELTSITTFGFRGEALASIAAVSKITLITKCEQDLEGTKLIVAENEIKEKTTIGCATGTEISIADLFYNIPARKKFLKTTQTEWRQIQLLINAFCFDYPHIQFFLFSDGKQVLNCPSAQDLKMRGIQLWESDTHQNLITLEPHSTDKLHIEGIISNHQLYRYDRSSIYLFVNNRWVKNFHLSSALIKGYINVIPAGRYPLAVIKITIDPHEVDINIHPRKEEVKFLHPQRVETALQASVKQALENNLSTQIKREVTFNKSAHEYMNTPLLNNSFKPFNFDAFFESSHDNQPVRILRQAQDERGESSYKQQEEPIAISPGVNTATIPYSEPNKFSLPFVLSLSKHTDKTNHENATIDQTQEQFYLIGQYKKTYLLIEKEDGLFLVDQHAAHERILYELFSQRFEDIATVQLLFPQIITLSEYDIESIIPHLTIFHENGIIIEQCASDQLIIQSTPVHLNNCSLDDLVHTVTGWIAESQSVNPDDFRKTIHEKLRAQMACKAAVKAGDILTHEQMQKLLDDLAQTNNRFSCPHGRPTGWLLSVHEIEKKFRRRL